jgi:CRP/FNR family cyclic AMP-dependent transcriptional regulator
LVAPIKPHLALELACDDVFRDTRAEPAVRGRRARLLLLLANFGKNGRPTPIDASINQATLAEMIGTTRSRVSFFLNKFRKLGLISYNGKIEVHRSLLNAVLYEKPELERDEKPTE